MAGADVTERIGRHSNRQALVVRAGQTQQPPVQDGRRHE
jgi:hypothetical protein